MAFESSQSLSLLSYRTRLLTHRIQGEKKKKHEVQFACLCLAFYDISFLIHFLLRCASRCFRFAHPSDLSPNALDYHCLLLFNTFTAIVDLSRFNNSCLKSPASTLVHITFQSRALRSFSLNQLRNLSL